MSAAQFMIPKSWVLVALLVWLSSGAHPQSSGAWNLVWHDEFGGSRLDPGRWTSAVGTSGNNELEYYTDRSSNVYLDQGMLVIRAAKETYTGTDGVTRDYTSGRISTKGKFAQRYGRFEARIRIPYGQGIWPAFWMMGDGTERWPDRGEIDNMENIGREPFTIHGTMHGPGYSGSKAIGAPFTSSKERFADDFHVYAVEWEPNAIRWYVDGSLYQTVTPAALPAGARWVFDHPFYLLLNVAVGGTWPGNPDATSDFPQSMLVDYVRVYQPGNINE
jgi:beta-glucanase (GH16 family)